LELWLRQRCQAVNELEIQLEGSMAELLRGHLQGVRLRARQVVFQQLSFERVDLHSDPIQLSIGGLWRGQPLQLHHPFRVRGSVLLTGEGLSRSLATPQWRPLADHLAEGLLGLTPLEGVDLLDHRLILRAQAEQVEAHMVITPTGLQLCPLDGRQPLPLQIDQAIRLELAEVRSGLLELKGEALVQP
jgi:hypothetical protein